MTRSSSGPHSHLQGQHSQCPGHLLPSLGQACESQATGLHPLLTTLTLALPLLTEHQSPMYSHQYAPTYRMSLHLRTCAGKTTASQPALEHFPLPSLDRCRRKISSLAIRRPRLPLKPRQKQIPPAYTHGTFLVTIQTRTRRTRPAPLDYLDSARLQVLVGATRARPAPFTRTSAVVLAPIIRRSIQITDEGLGALHVHHIFTHPLMITCHSASNSLLESRMSGLNMRSSQGSINEAHLKAASSLAYPHREHLLPQDRGYTSPTSTVSPVGSPHIAHGKNPGPFGLRTSGNAFGYNSVCILSIFLTGR